MKPESFLNLEVRGETLSLLADRALFWPKESLLCFSDVHLGKAESLQSLGLPIPSGDHLEDLGRIAQLLRATQAERVLILGDFIHQKRGLTEDLLAAMDKFLRFMQSVHFQLLLGNHERGSREILSRLPMQITEGDLQIGAFTFSHGHETAPANGDAFFIQGHIHPGVILRQGSTRLRLPCFWLQDRALTLPAFGSLNGTWEVRQNRRERVFPTTGEKVFEL